jgi:Zn-dependent protease with chaperone function
MGTLSLILVLTALSFTVAWLAAWPILGLWRLVIELPRTRGWARFNVVVLALPVLLGIVAALGAVWPSESLSWAAWNCHCAPASSSIHLCLVHPEESLPLLPVVVFLLLWLGWRPAQVVHALVRNLLNTRALLAPRDRRDSSIRSIRSIRLVELGTPNAFTAGLLRPVIVADQRWWSSLSPDERRVVTEHERAHAVCRDPLSYITARFLAGLVPPRVGKPLVASWLSFAERRADEHAARSIGDRALVAEFLLRQARMGQHALIPSFVGGDVEARIVALLDAPAHPLRLSSDVAWGLMVSALLAALLMGLFGFQIHKVVEHLVLLLS